MNNVNGEDLTGEMKDILLSLRESNKTQDELLKCFPKMSLETLGKLSSMGLIDHLFPMIWITSIGEKYLRKQKLISDD